MDRHVNIMVTGSVQGVFFRATAKEMAGSLGLTGFVRNEKDGSVYIEAEGDQQELDRFVAWCRKGPPGAVVTNVEIVDDTVRDFSSFEIRRSCET